ncbi:hypothetical protein SLA2020_365920 [Shorea laevis]
MATPRTVASHGCTPSLPAFDATGDNVVSHRLSPATLLRRCRTVQPTDQPNRTARTVASHGCTPPLPAVAATGEHVVSHRKIRAAPPHSFTTSG